VVAALHGSALALEFGSAFSTLPFELSVVGTRDLELTDVSVDADWLHVDPAALGTNEVSIDRSLISDASDYSSTLTWSSSAGVLKLPVHASSVSPLPDTDLGPLQVRLIDTETGLVARELVTTFERGYAFSFAAMEPGTYRLEVYSSASSGIDELGSLSGAAPWAPQVICVAVERDGCVHVSNLDWNVWPEVVTWPLPSGAP
jgi:hypothetical protein